MTASIEECADEEDAIVIEQRDEEIETLQEEHILRCFPNPTDATTTIQYNLVSTQDVQISIYSIVGERVQVLINETQLEGLHQVELDIANLESGNYFVVLRGNDFMEVEQLSVLR